MGKIYLSELASKTANRFLAFQRERNICGTRMLAGKSPFRLAVPNNVYAELIGLVSCHGLEPSTLTSYLPWRANKLHLAL